MTFEELISGDTEFWLKQLGNFHITTNNKELKGYTLDPDDGEGYKTYWDRHDLIAAATALMDAADALDALAQQ